MPANHKQPIRNRKKNQKNQLLMQEPKYYHNLLNYGILIKKYEKDKKNQKTNPFPHNPFIDNHFSNGFVLKTAQNRNPTSNLLLMNHAGATRHYNARIPIQPIRGKIS